MKKPTRYKGVSFSDAYLKEYEFISSLEVNKSKWICEAIREKMIQELKNKKDIEDLYKRIEMLEREVKNPKVVYIPQEGSNVAEIKKEEEKPNLKKMAGAIDW